MRRSLPAFLLPALLLAPSWAQADRESDMRKYMKASVEAKVKQADTDGDGALNRAETEQGLPYLAKQFDAVDVNGDGRLTAEEIIEHNEISKRARPGK